MSDQVSQAVETPAEHTQAPAPSPWASLFRIFVAPRSVFESLAPKPAFLVPLIVVALIQLGVGFFISRSDMVREATIAKMEQRGAPQEQIDATERMMESPVVAVFGTVGAVVGIVFVIFLGAGLLYFMANLMLGAKLKFTHFLCVSSFAQVIGVVDTLARTGLMFTRGTLHVPTGLGSFLGGDLSYPLRVMDMLTSPLLLWVIAIQAVGVSVFAKKGFGFGVLSALPGFVIAVLLGAIQQ
jgi:Yip1-like protein